LTLTRTLTEEQDRHVREHLREEELTVFDVLTRPGPSLTAEERDEVKKVTRQLLEKLNVLLVLDWKKRAAARAQVRLAIEDTLDDEATAWRIPRICIRRNAACCSSTYMVSGRRRERV
jgi:type I restriction enzyme R subunit